MNCSILECIVLALLALFLTCGCICLMVIIKNDVRINKILEEQEKELLRLEIERLSRR